MVLATLTCCKIHHMGAKPPHLLKPQELLEVQRVRTSVSGRRQVVAFRSNFRTALSTTRSFAQGRAWKRPLKRKKGRYMGIRVPDPSSWRKDPLRSSTCSVYFTDTREILPGPGFLTSTSPIPFGGVLPLCMGDAASVFLKAHHQLGLDKLAVARWLL